MDYAQFKLRFPKLEQAALEMFFDAGGSTSFRAEHEQFVCEWIAGMEQSDLEAAERELAAMDEDTFSRVVCPEDDEAERLASPICNWVVGNLFEGPDPENRPRPVAH